jgi:diacylglycerol kinase family enzyme
MAGIRIILHGNVAGDPEVREAVLALRKEGHLVEVNVTWEGGDAARLTGEAVADAHSGLARRTRVYFQTVAWSAYRRP